MAQEEEVLGKAYDSRLMKRLLQYLRPYKWPVGISLASILIKAVADVLGPYLVAIEIDRYLVPVPRSTPFDSFLSTNPYVGIAQIAAMYVGLIALGFLLDYLQTYFMQWAGQMVMFDLRKQIFRHLQHMHIGFYDKNPVGRLVTRVTSDVDALNEMFTSGVVSIFEDVFVLAGITAIMLGMNWKLALITLAVLPLIAYATKIFRDKVRDSYRRIRTAIARINAYMGATYATTAVKEFTYYVTLYGPAPSTTLRVVEIPDDTVPAAWAPEIAAIASRAVTDKVNYRLLANTIAHQWWGASVSPASRDDWWLSDGFARYSEARYVEQAAGEAGLEEAVKDMSVGALAYDTVPLSSSGKLDIFSPEFQSLVTDKGAMT